MLYMREELNYMNNDVFYFNWIDSAAKTQPTAQYLKVLQFFVQLSDHDIVCLFLLLLLILSSV